MTIKGNFGKKEGKEGGREGGREGSWRISKEQPNRILEMDGDVVRQSTCPLVRKMKVTWLFFKQ